MQLIFLPKLLSILICFAIWPIFQVSAALMCLMIKDNKFKPYSFFYRSHKWEDEGRIYKKIFAVTKWKSHLPDGGAVWKNGYKKKNLESFSKNNLEKFLIESCRAELTHWLAILPFWMFGFFTPPIVVFYMFLYALAINMPCIIAQRYNRPRIVKIMNSISKLEMIDYKQV